MRVVVADLLCTLDAWAGQRRQQHELCVHSLHLSLFLPAPRMLLPKILVLTQPKWCTAGREHTWVTLRSYRPMGGGVNSTFMASSRSRCTSCCAVYPPPFLFDALSPKHTHTHALWFSVSLSLSLLAPPVPPAPAPVLAGKAKNGEASPLKGVRCIQLVTM